MKLKLTLFGILMLVVVVFAVQNAEVVALRFLVWHVSLSRALLVLILFAAGMLSGWFLSAIARFGRKR